MRNSKKTEKSQKNQENELIFNFLKKKFLYEAEKKISKKRSLFEKEVKIDYKAAEKALNNKEAFYMKASLNPLIFTSNDSIVLSDIRENCQSQRIFDEKPVCDNRPFNRKYNTNNLFCVNKG